MILCVFYIKIKVQISKWGFMCNDSGRSPLPMRLVRCTDGNGFDFICNTFFSNIFHDMNTDSFVENVIKSIKTYLKFRRQADNFLADFIRKFHMFINYFFVALRKDVVWITVDFLIEDVDFISLLFSERNVFDIIKNIYFLLSGDERFLQFCKKLFEQGVDRLISEIFDHFEEPFRGGDYYFVRNGHPQEAKLDDKLLEPFKI